MGVPLRGDACRRCAPRCERSPTGCTVRTLGKLKKKKGSRWDPFSFLARPERFELPTARFVAEYSIQLSYGRIVWFSLLQNPAKRVRLDTQGRHHTELINACICQKHRNESPSASQPFGQPYFRQYPGRSVLFSISAKRGSARNRPEASAESNKGAYARA